MTTANRVAANVRHLYDRATPGWLRVWGDHLHHGHYGRDGTVRKDPVVAQVDMIEELMAWADPSVGPIRAVLDAGCGVGGSARLLADRFGAAVRGVTLSPVQRRLAERLSQGRSDVSFEVADASDTGYPEASFDLVWALESLEHMPDKRAFFSECARLLRPGGLSIVATWCHRPTPPRLDRREHRLLDAIARAYGDSLTWVSLADLEMLLAELPFCDVRTADWTEAVSPFWAAVLRSIATPTGLGALARGGRIMLEGAFGSLLMRRALHRGLVRYGVVRAVRRASR